MAAVSTVRITAIGVGLAEVLHGHQPTPQVLFTFPTVSLARMRGDPEVTPERFVT